MKVSLLLCLIVTSTVAFSQTIIASDENYGVGHSDYIWNSYTSGGDVTNSYEFIPAGFSFADKTKKYPVIFFFPGAGDCKSSDPNSVMLLRRGIAVELEGYGLGSPFNFIVIGMQGTTGSSAVDFARFIDNYAFVKYRDKIDFTRVYLTGLSLGGGKVMEYMADATRARKVAAIAPMCLATGCPILADCQGNTVVQNILDNPNIGVFMTHNVQDPSVPYSNSRNFYDELNSAHQAGLRDTLTQTILCMMPWSRGYAGGTRDYGNKNLYSWFMQFTSNAQIILPVKLSKFTAALTPSKATELNWVTSAETNSSHFVVERSQNGRDYAEISRINAAGNSNSEKDYKFTDHHPFAGMTYYRLKQFDKDGKYEYSETRRVNMSSQGLDVVATPNPFRSTVSLSIQGSVKTKLTVGIIDQMGRTVKQFTFVKSDVLLREDLSLGELAPGVYFLKVTGDNVNNTQRIVKQ
jgi:hypothetical protein